MPADEVAPYFDLSEIADQPARPSRSAGTAEHATATQPPMVVDVGAEFAKRTTVGRDPKEAIALTATWNAGAGLYDGFFEKASGALNAAYPTFLCLLSDNGSAMLEVMKRLGRKRKPKKGTEAVLALSLATKPQDNAQQKTCSDYAKVLVWAAENAVEVDLFLDRFAETDLKACTTFVRELRKRKKEAVTPVEAEGTESQPESGTTRMIESTASLPAPGKSYLKIEAVGEDGRTRTFLWGRSPRLVEKLLRLPKHHFHVFGPVLSALNEADPHSARSPTRRR